MTWLLESPLTILLFGVVVAALVAVALFALQRKWLLWTLLGWVAVVAAALVLERQVATPREEVHAALLRLADALEENDKAAVLALVSPRATDLRGDISSALDRYRVDSMSIKRNLQITVDGQEATAEGNVVFSGAIKRGQYARGTYPCYLVLEFVRDSGVWRVASLKDYVPVAGPDGRRRRALRP